MFWSGLADLPDEGPIISGGFPRYTVGDTVVVNCTSRRSRPAAKLRWYINGEQADTALVKKYKVRERGGEGEGEGEVQNINFGLFKKGVKLGTNSQILIFLSKIM